VEAKRLFAIRRLLFIVTFLLWAGGCATIEQSDHPAAIACIGSGCVDREPNNQIASFGPQRYQEMNSYYSSHCDEQTRELQHELANCTAVPLVNLKAKKYLTTGRD
jgi:hypothetical protein